MEGEVTNMQKARMAMYSIAGLYLVYLAYQLVGGISKAEGAVKILSILFAILFAIIGVSLTIFGIYRTYKMKKEEENPNVIEAEEKDMEETENETKGPEEK